MSTLYLDRRGLALAHERGTLVVIARGARERTVPLALLERIVIHGDVVLSTGVLAALGEAGVGLVALGARRARRVAAMLGPPHGDAALRLAQYALYADPARRLAWARRVVAAKIAAQRRFLARARRQRPAAALAAAEARLAGSTRRLHDADTPTLSWLLGLEGAASAAYFRGLAALFPASLGFAGRNRRPPRDPVNATLSLAYTLAHFETVQALYGAGLDPYVGAFHEPAHGRESLACDVVEPLRPLIDRWVWRLFAERTLRAEHFHCDRDACLLGKAGRRLFYGAYEAFAPPMRRLERRRARTIARAIRAGRDAPPSPDAPSDARALP